MSTEVAIWHAYSPEQYAKTVELWGRLLDSHRISLTEDRYNRGLEKVEPEHLYALVMSDGAATRDYDAVTVIVASHSDYHGDEYDAVNVGELIDTHGLNENELSKGYRAAWVQLGELPTVTDDPIDVGIERLEALVKLVEALTQGDVVCLNDEALEEYRQDRIAAAWSDFYAREVSHELEHLTGYNADDLGFTDDQVRDIYLGFEDNDWQFSDSNTVTNHAHEDTVDHVIDTIRDAWRAVAVDPEQTSLPIAS
ncbi:hypothetical protein [Saccharothrix sp. HUAS TT1]|uniref:hypothetical protein n=1 Tax=unclassified Saccharothrix TaxID=2593673 RepID=UPI00345BA2E2